METPNDWAGIVSVRYVAAHSVTCVPITWFIFFFDTLPSEQAAVVMRFRIQSPVANRDNYCKYREANGIPHNTPFAMPNLSNELPSQNRWH